MDVAVDFEGSFWDLADAAWAGSDDNPAPGIGKPFQGGAMMLLGPGQVRCDFPDGQIHFTRHRGLTLVPGLCG